MRIGTHVFLIALPFLLVHAPSADAVGYGVYFEYDNVFDGELDEVEYDEDHFGVGLSLDTNVSEDRLFNYRLDVGYQRVDQDGEHANGILFDNFFGFGLLRTERVRLWMGPAVRTSFDFSEHMDRVQFDGAIGGGPALGLNVHSTARLSLALTAGYAITFAWSLRDREPADDGSPVPFFRNADGHEQLAFIKLHVFLRDPEDRFAGGD